MSSRTRLSCLRLAAQAQIYKVEVVMQLEHASGPLGDLPGGTRVPPGFPGPPQGAAGVLQLQDNFYLGNCCLRRKAQAMRRPPNLNAGTLVFLPLLYSGSTYPTLSFNRTVRQKS